MAVADEDLAIIHSIAFGLDELWHEVPLDEEASAWTETLAAELGVAEGNATALFRSQLAVLHEHLVAAAEQLDLTAAVWVPHPESGVVAAVMGFTPLPLPGTQLSAEDVLAGLIQIEDEDEDSAYLETDHWTGDIAAGPFAASHQALVNPEADDEQGWVEERVDYVVLPPDAAQLVHVFFSTDNMIAFEDMAGQTQELLTTMEVELKGAGE